MLTLGIDVGASKVSVALVKNGRILRSCKHYYRRRSGGAVKRAVLQCCTFALGKAKISGVGLGVPCAFNKTGRSLGCANILWLSPEKLAKTIRKKMGVPVRIENDVKVASLAEIKYGAGRRSKNFVFVALGTGIGGAVVIDGKLYKGALGWAGELGHMIMQVKNTATWEEISTKRFLKSKKGSKDVENLAKQVGIGLLNIVYTFAPEVIVIGGGLSSLWNRRFGKVVLHAMSQRIISKNMPFPKITRSRLGENAGVIGAALSAAK